LSELEEEQQQAHQQQQQQTRRVYLVTEGLKSAQTVKAYQQAFEIFLKATVKHRDLQGLLDTKQNVIESKIIDHISYLKDGRKLTHLSIKMHHSGIFPLL
jgi:RecG-like helicase